MQLYWHRRNLQPSPNPALSAAVAAARRTEGRVLPLFVLDDAILSRADGLGTAFMLGSLRELRDWYQDHGSDLVIQHGDPTEVVARVARRTDVDRVVWNDDHSRLARRRDRAVRRALTRTGVAYTAVSHEEQSEPRALATSGSEPEAYLASPHAFDVETRPVPQLAEVGGGAYDSAPLTAGTDAARKRLRALSNGTTYRRCDDESTGDDGGRRDVAPNWA
jgi:Deoxyribodipyrimidine photolyase